MTNSILEHNLAAMDDAVYGVLKQKLVEEISNAEGYECLSADVAGREVLFVQSGDKTYQLDTLYDQQEMLDIWYNGLAIQGYETKIVFCGFGNGMYVKKILETADPSARILVYEPSSVIFKKCLETYDVSECLCNSRVTFVVEGLSDKAIEDEVFKLIKYQDIRNSVYHAYPNYDQFMPQQVKDFDNLIQTAIMKIRATQSVLARYGRKNATNSLRNTKVFMNSKSLFSFNMQISKSIPAVIIASGPSLSKSIDDLKYAKGKAFLVAVDSAVPALMKYDIVPDMVITVDSQKNAKHIEDERAKKIPMLCELESRSALVGRQTGPILFMNDLNPYVNKFHRREKIELPVFPSGGSVANTACAVLDSMGFENIVFVGQDLAYTDNKAYADGTVGSKRAFSLEDKEEIFVDGYFGDKVRSSSEFFLYLNWFENEIKKNPHTHYYNATQGGALIKGAENVTLREAVDRIGAEGFDMDDILNKTAPLYTEEQKKRFSEYMIALPEILRKDMSDAERAMRDYDKICQLLRKETKSANQIKKLLESSSEITTRLEKAFEMYYVFCFGQEKLQEISDGINNQEDDLWNDIMTSAVRGREYLSAMVAAGRELLTWMDGVGFVERWTV